ncbi:MFS transporter [Gilvimarinus sp. SDUM040013]|uniref:MFS transporter n=1 Tax=Gilvimarinus gilvus TaxID=3058038 RepID=A0ABU4RXC4_9GAMM|nr:MFS transporter [Gilvimarinus sp. SDUM040013]MDO3386767.1 MFS transporter [Gilvimarinus sp. SDUM040013]MDX6848303.1 MFS transporter [Gilvimarinus sp. SDUM040013]
MVCLGAFIAPLGMASVNVAIPALAQELSASGILVSWVPTAVLVANIICMLPAGKLADNWGRKRVFQLGIVINALAGISAYFASGMWWLLAMRFMQGMGAAMIFATSMAILISVFPVHRRGLPLGLNAACVYLGLTLAPALGGWVTHYLGWRFVFLLPLPLVSIVLVLSFFYVKGEWRNAKGERFDWRGALLLATWAITLVFGFTSLPSPVGFFTLCASCLLFAGFVWGQLNSKAPLIRVQMFSESRLFSMSLAAALFMYASSYPLGFLLSLYLQYVLGLSAADAGQIMLSQALAMAVVAPFAGKLADFFPARILSSVGCGLTLAGFFLLHQLQLSTTGFYISVALGLVGVGFGLFSSPNNLAVMQAAHPSETGVASATLNLARVSGNLVGMSLVNLLVYSLIGDRPLTGALAEPILATFLHALELSMSFVALAVIFSLLRGKACAR